MKATTRIETSVSENIINITQSKINLIQKAHILIRKTENRLSFYLFSCLGIIHIHTEKHIGSTEFRCVCVPAYLCMCKYVYPIYPQCVCIFVYINMYDFTLIHTLQEDLLSLFFNLLYLLCFILLMERHITWVILNNVHQGSKCIPDSCQSWVRH